MTYVVIRIPQCSTKNIQIQQAASLEGPSFEATQQLYSIRTPYYRAMVLFFPIIAAIPTVIGISEGIAEKNRAKGGVSTDPLIEKEQMRKFILECYCDQNSKRAKEVHGGKVVLRDGKVISPTEYVRLMANSMLPI